MKSILMFAALMFGCLSSGGAVAASLEITPVAINLAAGQRATTIRVRNRGATPAAVQVRVYAWTQQGDKDVLVPTNEIILSPPIFTVGQGASQTLRLLLRGGGAAGGERSYRLLLDEVPPANTGKQQVAIAMRVSLPLIAASSSQPSGALLWRADRGVSGRILLSASNNSNSYKTIQSIAVLLPDGSRRDAVASGDNPHVLTGATRQWVVQGPAVPAGPLRLAVTTQAGKSEHILALAP